MARQRRTGLATLDEAKTLVFELLKDGDWHSSREIHNLLRPRFSEGMFLRVKRALEIEHRQVGGGEGSYFEWRLPATSERSPPPSSSE
jgi:hypothetical protein